jgi:dTDP-4-dehydrorhamnose 3,5-epimerase
MKVEETALPGVLLLHTRVFADERGAFFESFNLKAAVEAGLPSVWVQDNFSVSKKNVVRGIHYQIIQPQGKLVWVAYGEVVDVAVDLRRSSPHFGKHVAVRLKGASGDMLWIPPGFGHGFAVLSESAGFSYKVTDSYCAAGERTILWNDPKLAIDWPVSAAEAVLSEKDRQARLLDDAELFA